MSDSPQEWSGDRVARWLAQASELEHQLAPVSQALMAAAVLAPGERVLDVGCGTGPTTRQAASLLGPDGSVTGLDVAAEMLQVAARRPAAGGVAPIEWVCADAVDWAGPAAAYDVVLSRFGVMFFSDPPAAMRTLASVTRPGGRLALAVWGARDESPLFEVPYQAARAALRDLGVPLAESLPVESGPYSWHDAATVTDLLCDAGWDHVSVSSQRLALPAAGGDPAGAARAAQDFGPTRLLLADHGEAERAAAVGAIEQALAGHTAADGSVVLDGTVRVITARVTQGRPG